MRKFRFWLSRLIFGKILKWPSAQKVAEEIDQKVKEWNSAQTGKCEHCGGAELTEDRSGSEGFFTSPHHFYRCPGCHNTQDHRYDLKLLFQELGERRITEDGEGQYRYSIFTIMQWALLLVLLIFVVAVGIAFLLS